MISEEATCSKSLTRIKYRNHKMISEEKIRRTRPWQDQTALPPELSVFWDFAMRHVLARPKASCGRAASRRHLPSRSEQRTNRVPSSNTSGRLWSSPEVRPWCLPSSDLRLLVQDGGLVWPCGYREASSGSGFYYWSLIDDLEDQQSREENEGWHPPLSTVLFLDLSLYF
jgi:hypothetical protein